MASTHPSARKQSVLAFLRAHSISLNPSDISEGLPPAQPPRLAGRYVLQRANACEWIEFDGRFWMTCQGILLIPHRSQDIVWYGLRLDGAGGTQIGPMTL